MDNIKSLIDKLNGLGIKLWTENGQLRYQAPKGAMTAEIVSELKENKEAIIKKLEAESASVQFEAHPDDRYSQFPLTNIQNSYVVGRNSAYSLGDVTCHGYIEITYEEELDRAKLQKAWNTVIAKHDMLRVVVYADGYQMVQESVPEVEIPFYDLKGKSQDDITKAEEDIRSIYAEKQYELGKWPMCDVVLSVRDGKSVIHFSLDMLITDFMSANLILDDLDRCYHGEAIEPTVETLYRDIVLHGKKLEAQRTEKRIKDEEYWNEKIKTMGDAPDLITSDNAPADTASFRQVKYFVDHAGKEAINRYAQKMKITGSVLILSAFSEVINRWSKNSKFCINLTMLSRDRSIPGVDKVVGDFTDVNVLSVDLGSPMRFGDRITQIQNDLWEDLQHNSVSGVEVLRDLGRSKKENLIIPVVYTSTLGVASSEDSFLSRSNISYKISQTPQVWIDCQISEENDGITVNWDYRTGIFDTKVINEMFGAFSGLIAEFAKENYDLLDSYDPIPMPAATADIRGKLNSVTAELPDTMMTDGFINSVKLYPNKTALITKDGEYTYTALAKHANAVKNALISKGFKSGELAAVMLPKGIWQIAGVLGVLLAGGVYLPTDPMQPVQRRQAIIEDSGLKFILAEKEEDGIGGDGICVINVNDLAPDKESAEVSGNTSDTSAPAYIIYTSGTTGKPKGVVITHAAAMNTIYDINERFSIGKDDVFFGLANLAFDLSVYDIFGAFTAGGTLVLPDDKLKKNPKHILDLLIINKITVWNSVPAQMKMVDTYMDSLSYDVQCSLRVVMMSGDWIPVDLPESLYKKIPGVRVVSLGGATEAAIWSIFYEVPSDYEKKNSIPYGYPLSNQKFYVLNAGLEECPDGVPGDLYIAGKGLAKEYFHDAKLTAEKFLFRHGSGERIYKTGDVGRYDENGVIEFLGRSDTQVKIRGHRIELSEIDSVLSAVDDIRDVSSIVIGNAQEDMRIVTAAVPRMKEVGGDMYDRDDELKSISGTAEELTKSIDRELLPKWIETANKVVLSDIFMTLYNSGIFTEDRGYSFAEVLDKLNVPEKLHKLMKRWLTVLCKENITVMDGEVYKVNMPVASEYLNKDMWQEMYSVEEKLHYSKKLLDYLKTSSSVLPELMAGKEDPLNLLFPQGEMDVAMAAYHDNIINTIMNGLAKAEIAYLAENNPSGAARILEVGAGVGGTSVDVIPALEGTGAEYNFTDLSTFFLNSAKEKFEKYDWVKYGIFDINMNVADQYLEPFSVDTILAANVLHNAKNIHNVFDNLKKLLKPNARMVILEETRESYTLLTSMEFKDGLTGFTDERGENQTFFSREQWESIFDKNGAEIVYQYPPKGDALEMAGQTIYVIRFNEAYADVKKDALLDVLEDKLPEYMVPSQIALLPELPQTNNGKIDRKKIAEYFLDKSGSNETVDSEDMPQTELEKQIAEIWCRELNVSRIGRNDNFYLVGGDSLLIAQVIAKMRDKIPEAQAWQWDDLLKEMMKTPTIRGIAKTISEKDGSADTDKSLVILREPEHKGKKATVVFHAGTGTLTPYNQLMSYINEQSGEDDAVYGFTFGDEAEYLAIPTEKTFEVLGGKYGKILDELDYSEYVLIGHCVGGLIALETAQYLQSKGRNVSSVTLLSTSIPFKKEQTVLSDLDDEVFANAVHTSLYNELLLERTFAALISADIFKAGHKVDNDTLQKVIEHLIFTNGGNIHVQDLCSLDGEFAEVGKEFSRLAAMSATERMNDLYATIERPDGQLMEHQQKMLNVLFRVFAQNFRCVSSYKAKPYTGRLRVFNCESPIANFFPSLFSEDRDTWEPLAKGEFYFGSMKGDHISCMNSPYIEENVKLILDFSK